MDLRDAQLESKTRDVPLIEADPQLGVPHGSEEDHAEATMSFWEKVL